MAENTGKARYKEALEELNVNQLKDAYDAAFYSECTRLIGDIQEECSRSKSITERAISIWIEDMYSNAAVERVVSDLKNIGFTVQVATMKVADPTLVKPASLEITW